MEITFLFIKCFKNTRLKSFDGRAVLLLVHQKCGFPPRWLKFLNVLLVFVNNHFYNHVFIIAWKSSWPYFLYWISQFPHGFLLTSVRTATHGGPSVTGHNCPVGNETASETVGQGWRRKYEHVGGCAGTELPPKSPQSRAVATFFGSMEKLHREQA